jgi:acyl transferase domain-containing protein
MASRAFPRRQYGFPRFSFSCLSSHRPASQARGTFLKNINRFDNIEFGIGNKDGKSLVMATRKLVELSFLALQDAGIEYRGRKIGSFMSGTSTEHWTPVSALCP